MPNCPAVFVPQAHNAPDVVIPKPLAYPAETLSQVVNAPICFGLE
jgi:hypothetical protein